MKRISFMLLAVLLVAVCCKKETSSTDVDSSLTKVIEEGQFVMGLDDSFPPMGFQDENGKIVGYDIDLAHEVCSRIGVELVLQPIDWAAKEQELNTNKIDCIWNGFTITPEREAVLAFTKPYLDNAQVLIVKKDSGITTLSDLKKKKLGLQAGSSAADALNANPEFQKSLGEVIEFKDNLTAFMDLEIGGVDAVLIDMVVGNYNIKTTGKPFVVLAEKLSSEKYGIGLRKSDIALRDKIQATLEEMATDGTIAKISTFWFDKDISVIGK